MRADQFRSSIDAPAVATAATTTTAPSTTSPAVLPSGMVVSMIVRNSSGGMSASPAPAAIMAMNNVYYRFRHMVGKEVYAGKPARHRPPKCYPPELAAG